ncbi:excinuclease ABC subunit UvrC [Candidatus Uhrbacteria bacterium]|nr:excinuclease ABC subunit UvrC [Candidatus Uhrbacteria bacterium]
MAIPTAIVIQGGALPDASGVYLYYDNHRTLLYVGKATSLKKRVSSYFNKKYQRDDDLYARRIVTMVQRIAQIDYIETPTVIEALVLEANLIRSRKPHFNIQLTDDKSFLYLALTNEPYPRPVYVRGLELARKGIDPFSSDAAAHARAGYLAVYGPYTSPRALKQAMELLRRIFPWSICEPPSSSKRRPRPCFDYHIHKCPGVCVGAITPRDYQKNIRGLQQFLEGKKAHIITRLERDMQSAARRLAFERAAELKRQRDWLTHIRDVSVITKDFSPLPYENPDKGRLEALARIEAYDISNISGTDAVGSMVVLVRGEPRPSLYRRFRIKTVTGSNDVAMMREVIERRLVNATRFPNAWSLPDVFVIDGGKPQVNAVRQVLALAGVRVPIIGLAKGPDRKKDEPVFDASDAELARMAHTHKESFQLARDEAHRFAVVYHRKRRSMR